MGRTTVNPLSIIVAVDHHGGFAREKEIPWNLPEDLKHFRETTTGHPCIMGRNTYDEIVEWYKAQQTKNEEKGKQVTPVEQIESILPNREVFVVTSNTDQHFYGATAVSSMRRAINSLNKDDMREVFVLGGFRLFTEALSWADNVYMTIVKKDYQCDQFFPIEYVYKNFNPVDGESKKRVDFVTYKRKQ